MDEAQIILYFAILSLGLFIGTLVGTTFYILVLRPRLLDTRESDDLAGLISRQTQIVLDLQHELASHTVQLSNHIKLMETQQQAQGRLTSELRSLRSDQRERGQTPDLITLLNEHQKLLQSLHQIASNTHLAVKDQRRTLNRQLAMNEAVLHRLTDIVQTESLPSDQLSEILSQIDSLAKLIQQVDSRPVTPTLQDRLTDIKGVGPVYSGILHEAGIHTFEQLSRMAPQEINNLLNLPKWRKVDTESWIRQSRDYASQRQKLETGT